MLGSASSEFIALCQSQVLLLSQALGASSTVVYLAEPSSDLVSPTLVPLVAYPDNADVWAGLQDALSTMGSDLPEVAQASSGAPNLLISGQAVHEAASSALDTDRSSRASGEATNASHEALSTASDSSVPQDEPGATSNSPQPLILPLAHEGVVLGVMVSTREALSWNRDDYQQAEQVANSLAIACVMDQRSQWLQSQLRQRQLTQTDQSQTFHDLLHQFRNPLTALQTFGKLLVKRMQPDDPNHPIAEGIVRETGRLRDLAQNFDEAIARGDADLDQAIVTPPLDQFLLPAAPSTHRLSSEQFPSHAASVGEGAPETGKPDSIHAVEFPRRLSHSQNASEDQSHHHQSLGRELEIDPGRITAVITPLLLSATAIAQDREMNLVQDLPPDLPEVWLDASALREVLSNLLDNALKYAPKGALVWVAGGLVQQLNGKFYQGIAIGDTGPGIPPQDQAHIFERHYRGVQADSPIPGTGLGLAIVKELVEAMGGHIDLISPIHIEQWLPVEEIPRVKGPGSLFIVWLKTV